LYATQNPFRQIIFPIDFVGVIASSRAFMGTGEEAIKD
jgi:hypothetical protein